MLWFNHPSFAAVIDPILLRLKEGSFRFRKLRSVIFLCGGAGSAQRDAIANHLKANRADTAVFYADDVWLHISSKTQLDSLQMEEQLAQLADMVLIVVESPGTFAELGAFSISGPLRKKVLPILSVEHVASSGFIASGPVRWLNKESMFSPAIYADFAAMHGSFPEIERRIDLIPSRPERVEGVPKSPKHLLFIVCDLVAVFGPLIRAVALLHQNQRPVHSVSQDGKTIQFIEVVPDDVAVANRLAHLVFGRSLDELPPQTRTLLLQLDRIVREDCEAHDMERSDYRFTRRYVRERLGSGDSQLKLHLRRLVEMELVAVHRGDPAHRHSYELLYDGGGKDGTPFLTGLIDASKLKPRAYDGDRAGVNEARAGSGRPPGGGWAAGGRGADIEESSNSGAGLNESKPSADENARPGDVSESGS